jgi:hypothetical protein
VTVRGVLIYRHPDCGRCARIAARHHRLDWLGRIQDTTEPPPDRAPVRKGEIAVRELDTGELREGVHAVRAIFRQVPLYWPLLALLAIPAVARRADVDARDGEQPCDPW